MKPKAILSLVCSSLLIIPRLVSAADSLTPRKPVEMPGTQGKFDFIKIDSASNRLLACHAGNGSLDVIDVITSKLIKSIPTGNAQGVAIDSKNNRYFVSVSKPPKMVIVDSTKLEVIGEVPLPGPADLIAYHAETNRVFICRDDKPVMWVIDPVEKKILSTINFPGGGMEDLGFDSQDAFLFQCLKDSSELAKLDLKTEKICRQMDDLSGRQTSRHGDGSRHRSSAYRGSNGQTGPLQPKHRPDRRNRRCLAQGR
jgi:hypothetical protein